MLGRKGRENFLVGGNLQRNEKCGQEATDVPSVSSTREGNRAFTGLAEACGIQAIQGDAFKAVTNDAT